MNQQIVDKMSFIRNKLFNLGILISIVLIFLQFFSCRFSDKKRSGQIKGDLYGEIYKPPSIPLIFRSSVQQANYLTEHYWDNFSFNDTSVVNNSKRSEKAFVEFITILGKVDYTKAVQGIDILIKHSLARQKTFLLFLGLAEKYLHDPNSPVRNETFYEPFLRALLASQAMDENNKIRYQKQFDLALKNKPGQKAIEFRFTLINGSSSTLYQIKSKLLLIYFHNPDCSECKAVKEKISQSKVIRHYTEKGDLKILSVYPDSDPSLWKEYYSELPASWTNSFDKGSFIKEKELYDLKAIPTLYLLDGSKTVLLRDASFEEIEEYLLTLK